MKETLSYYKIHPLFEKIDFLNLDFNEILWDSSKDILSLFYFEKKNNILIISEVKTFTHYAVFDSFDDLLCDKLLIITLILNAVL